MMRNAGCRTGIADPGRHGELLVVLGVFRAVTVLPALEPYRHVEIRQFPVLEPLEETVRVSAHDALLSF